MFTYLIHQLRTGVDLPNLANELHLPDVDTNTEKNSSPLQYTTTVNLLPFGRRSVWHLRYGVYVWYERRPYEGEGCDVVRTCTPELQPEITAGARCFTVA